MDNKKGIFGIIVQESVKQFYATLKNYRAGGKTVEPSSSKWVFRFASHPDYEPGDKSFIGKLLPGSNQKEDNLRVTYIPRQTGIAQTFDINPDILKGFTFYKLGAANLVVLPQDEGWFALDSIDLTSVGSINLFVGWQAAPTEPIAFEIRLDAPDGKSLGKGTMPPASKSQQFGVIKVPLAAVSDGKFHTVYFVYKPQGKLSAGISSVQFNAK